MKNVNDVITIMENEIEILKRLIKRICVDNDELLNSKVSIKSCLISSYGEQISVLTRIINFIKGDVEK